MADWRETWSSADSQEFLLSWGELHVRARESHVGAEDTVVEPTQSQQTQHKYFCLGETVSRRKVEVKLTDVPHDCVSETTVVAQEVEVSTGSKVCS